jgi:hypothetical protein
MFPRATSSAVYLLTSVLVSASSLVGPVLSAQEKKKDKEPPALEFEGGVPVAEALPKNAWKVSGTVHYKYPAGWEFKELRIEAFYQKKGEMPSQSSVVLRLPNEMANGTPGRFSCQFDNLRTPGEGETLNIKAVLVAKHAQFGEGEWSLSSPVPAPAK